MKTRAAFSLYDAGRDIALRCPRPRRSGRNHCAAEGGADGAARRPYLCPKAAAHRAALRRQRSARGFTLVEIAIALGVIGFALVAIIGILPVGMQIQRDNRAETIINQDGTFWLEAIRNGARGLDELVDHVERIDVVTYNPLNGAIITSNYFTFGSGYTTGSNIIGLLTTPAHFANTEAHAVVTAISGAAAEKSPSAADRELAFRYQMTVQIEQPGVNALPFTILATNSLPAPPIDPLESLYEVRLNMAYNWVRDTQPGTRRQTYRSTISRSVLALTNQSPEHFFFVQ